MEKTNILYQENNKMKCNGIIIENGILFNGTDPHLDYNSNLFNEKSQDDYIIPKVKAPKGKKF